MDRVKRSNIGNQIDIGFPPSQESGLPNPKERLYSSEAIKTGMTFTSKCHSLRAQVHRGGGGWVGGVLPALAREATWKLSRARLALDRQS